MRLITSWNKKVVHALEAIGLTELEARIYLHVLHYSPCGAGEIVKALELDKSSTYRILDGLVAEGLVQTEGEKYGLKYIVHDPEYVLSLAQQKQEEIKNAQASITDLVSRVESTVANDYRRNFVDVFEGVEGVRSFWREQLTSEETIIRALGLTSILSTFMPDYQEFMVDFAKRRARKGLFLRSLCVSIDADEVLDRSDDKWKQEVRYLPEGFTVQSAFIVFDGVLGFVYPKNDKLTGIVLRDPIIASFAKSLFDQVWQMSTY